LAAALGLLHPVAGGTKISNLYKYLLAYLLHGAESFLRS
jgi:hypothetical protein